MTQEQLNILLAFLTVASPLILRLVEKYFTHKKDNVEFGSDLLQLANDATEALRKTREELLTSETNYEKTIASIRAEHDAAIASIRSEYDSRHERLKSRILELEKVQKIYAIQFDLVTHPNVEIRNMQARKMDDMTASQKLRAIKESDLKKSDTEST